MRFHLTGLPGVLVVQSPEHEDNRGSFRRLWCAEIFAKARLDFSPVQASLSTSTAAHTLRGMHWQAEPHGEQKLVRCLAGAIWDVALDLRPDSPSYLLWHAEHLTAGNGRALFLPSGVAHGFLSLTSDALVDYLIDRPHAPEAARGARWNDPAFAIDWPAAPQVLSDRDRTWPDFAHV
ncbi:MAG: dTDP-4-dehydrorhamnose 3,5-epimerase family protein [Gemmobacter sp.]|jgi:dTDP-4-dehydrorhamnose 3,5-epimerase|nr:dTDP-4-dehydrorhamnose 3,5-epimerase family protein [Gemmobacter sp.]